MQLLGYSLDRLRNDEEFILYRAHPKQTGLPSVLLLAPASTRPSPETLKKIDHEYSLRSELDSAWAVRPLDLSERGAQMMLVREDPGGETLDGFLSGPMELTQFLGFAVGLATALGGLHERKLIHKDVKPTNILVDSATGRVRLMGFGIASHLRREYPAPEPPEFIAGTLPYMAPEQTGRMNRSIDSRSDLYALGVTLYEMLTGNLPFIASDPIEWVHCHIARHPVPPHERVKSVPTCVSAIVMKLLAKTPEERYQTASGVESDLQRCLAEWEANKCVIDFPLGQHDAPDRLLIPEKLYGRQLEIETLLKAFDRVVAGGGPELVLVSGYSGIGKSAVVNELHKPLVPPRGLFASGKFDQYKRDIPYSTLAQAFQSLVRPLLSKSDEELNKWRNVLREALDPNGQLMVDLVPELKVIIGEQPPVPQLSLQDDQRRFRLVFRRFINVFARPEHPLALFLDDLQWLDAATLELMEDLLTQPDFKNLMLIGAYRDNEVDATHPLMRRLKAMREAGAHLQDIVLAPLTREELEELIADSLRCGAGHGGPLAEMVHDKTSGNPFFAIQFLSALFEEGLLTFDPGERRWSWDLNRIHAKGYTDNVVDLMVGKLSRVIPETQNALKQLACLGNSAEFTMLRAVYEDSVEQMHAELAQAVEADLILRSNDSYRFLHDRIQEAVYSLIPEEVRAETHLRIGTLMASHTPPDKIEERIFEIVNQLNRGLGLITSVDEREQLAELNLMAGRRANASTAYASALRYFITGRELLAEDCWKRRRELIFALEFHRAECELLTAALSDAEYHLTALAARATDTVNRACVARLRMNLHIMMNQQSRAIAIGLDYLNYLGISWSPCPTDEQARRAYEDTWSELDRRASEQLVALPLMTDQASLATLDVLNRLCSPAQYTDLNLYTLAACQMLSLTLDRGNSDASAVAYGRLGMIAGLRFGEYERADRVGQLAYELVERCGLRHFEAGVYLNFGNFVMPWTRHIRAGCDLMGRAFEAAEKTGDLLYAGVCCAMRILNLASVGDALADVQREAESALVFLQKTQLGPGLDTIPLALAMVRMLRGATTRFGSLDDGLVDEQRIERDFASTNVTATQCWYWVCKLRARFMAGDYAMALDAASRAQPLLSLSLTIMEVADYHFYSALSHAAFCDSVPAAQRTSNLEALAAHHRQLASWATVCPENFEDRAALVGSEIARIEDRVLEAEQRYEQAIRSAHSNGFVHNEAIAYELAARFYAARGFQRFADAYLLEARYRYQRWGADGKVAQLDRLYPHLKKESLTSTPTSTILAPAELLDVATVIKVSQAVSGEMVLEKLIDNLMRSAIEHAGAERGLLILPRNVELQIEAEATIRGDNVSVHRRGAPAAAADLPESLVRYVMRTQENVILEDALSGNSFSADPYFVRHRARSILCLPLINQRKLAGVLYLENNLAPHVFTPDRIAVLKVLASQAAMSLENTRLYRELEVRERKIGRLIDSNIIGIFFWDLEGRILEANDEFLRMIGYDRDDLVSGRLRWTDLTPPEWVDRDTQYTQELQKGESVQAFEKEYFRKDGSRVPVLLGVFSFEAGTNQGVAFILDLSEQKRAEEALRRSEAYLAEAQSLTHTGSCAIDGASHETVYWSDEMFRLFGFDPQQGAPKWEQFLEQIHAEDREKVRFACNTTFRAKVNWDVEFRIVKPDGAVKHIHAIGHPVVGPSGQLVQVLATMVDVTERKLAEEARDRLRQLEADLTHINRVSTMGELTASLAHEIKQPIGAAVTNAEACLRLLNRDQPDLPEARLAAFDMVRDARRAADIVDRVRSLYQKGSPQLDMVDVNELIREMVIVLHNEAHRYSATMRTHLAEKLPKVMADRVQLQQALMNLMLNGIEAMGGTTGELSIKSRLGEDDQVLISVSDTGVGLPAENADQIFNAFFTTKSQGTGLGLAITRSIVESHGGCIWATANSGPGATFQLTLPIREAASR